MGMQIEPTKVKETKKSKNEEKPQKIENEEKGNLSLERGAKIYSTRDTSTKRSCGNSMNGAGFDEKNVIYSGWKLQIQSHI